MMQIELTIDGKRKTFTAPFVPMLANRLYLRLEHEAEERDKDKEENPPSLQEIMEHDDKRMAILADVVFNGQFTLDDMYAGADEKYLRGKLMEAIYGVKLKNQIEEEEESGNPTNRD